MSDLSRFVSEDSRKPIERLRRATLYRFADAYGITYPNQAPKTTLIKLLEANGVDVTRPMPEVEMKWKQVNGQTTEGVPRTEIYPVEPEHASARKGVDSSFVLHEKMQKNDEENERIKELEAQNESLKEQNTRLQEIAERLAALEEGKQEPKKEEVPAKFWDLYRYAQKKGVPVKRGMKRKEILALLEKQGGEDSA